MATRKFISGKTKKNARTQKGGSFKRPSRVPNSGIPPKKVFNSRKAFRRPTRNIGLESGFSKLGKGWTGTNISKLDEKISSLRLQNTNITKLQKGLSSLGTLYNQKGTRKTLKSFSNLGYAEQGALTKLAKSTGFSDAQHLHSVLGAGRTNLINQLKAQQIARGSMLETASQNPNLANKVRKAISANAKNPKLAAARAKAQRAMSAYPLTGFEF